MESKLNNTFCIVFLSLDLTRCQCYNDIGKDDKMRELVKEEQDNIAILAKIGEIEGLILDIFT